MKQNQITKTAIILYFLAPYFILLGYFFAKGADFSVPERLWDTLQFTKWQALLSATSSLLLGFVASFGLLGLRETSSKLAHAVTLFILLPSAVPVLIVILSVLNLFPETRGLLGIVLIHTLINIGLVAVVCESLIRNKVGSYLELAQVEGASFFKILSKVILPLLGRDFVVLFFAVFAFCFASFSVPLLIGGSQATTIEVLIYELIRVDGNWGQALVGSILQTAIVLLFAIFIAQEQPNYSRRETRLNFLSIKPFIVIALLPSALVVVGLCSGLISGFSQLFNEISFATLGELAINSFLISFGVALLCLAGLVALALIQPQRDLRKFILGFVAPSSVLTGFAILILWRSTGAATLIKIMLGLSFIFIPVLYRLGWDARINSLRGQVLTAESLGASRWLIFKKICWPQMSSVAAQLVALASFWAWGEFALTRILSERTLTLSLLVQSLMSSYRLNSATALVWLMFIGSAITYFIIWGLIHVSGRKSFN